MHRILKLRMLLANIFGKTYKVKDTKNKYNLNTTIKDENEIITFNFHAGSVCAYHLRAIS